MTSKRQLFSEPQVAQYFERETLSKMTGRPVYDFHRVLVKELVDNSLDAAESAGIAPEIVVRVIEGRSIFAAHVVDNGNGIAPETLDKLLDFSKFTSDKSLYRSPTRGQQGNALKTIFAMPYATGYTKSKPVVESLGFRHTIHAGLDEAGLPKVERVSEPLEEANGTKIFSPIGLGKYLRTLEDSKISDLIRGYHLYNPHLKVSFEEFVQPCEQRPN